MGEATKIAWAGRRLADGSIEPGYSWSPWWGCAEVSPGCAHCYAKDFSKRVGHGKRLPMLWGKGAERRMFGEAHWKLPLRWERRAAKDGVKRRVFCASMADVCEDRPELVAPRLHLRALMQMTPHLEWLLLTKRPENLTRLFPELPKNVLIGTTAENQEELDKRWPLLLEAAEDEIWFPRLTFLSCEPLLGPLYLGGPHFPSWVIAGGESGPKARDCDPLWLMDLADQCARRGIPFFMKQLGSRSRLRESFRIKHPHGADPSEWPEHYRVQEWPT